MYDFKNPMSAKLPNRVSPGDLITLVLPWDEKSFLSMLPTQIGLSDSFWRRDWVSRKQLKDVIENWKRAFPDAEEKDISSDATSM